MILEVSDLPPGDLFLRLLLRCAVAVVPLQRKRLLVEPIGERQQQPRRGHLGKVVLNTRALGVGKPAYYDRELVAACSSRQELKSNTERVDLISCGSCDS